MRSVAKNALLSVFVLGLLLPAIASAEKSKKGEKLPQTAEELRIEAMSERHRRFLDDVALLMTDTERQVFVDIDEDYQRDAFMRRFWRIRDPFPETGRNELRDRWLERATKARELYGDLLSERARMVMMLGEPGRRDRLACELYRQTLEIWTYPQGADGVSGTFHLVWIGANKNSFSSLWQPRDGLVDLLGLGVRGSASEARLGALIQDQCVRGDLLLSAISQSLDTERLMSQGPWGKKPNDEWVMTFQARSTQVPEGAEMIRAEVDVSYPGRHQSRTVVQGLITITDDQLTLAELGDYRGYNLLVDGEVLRQGELFDRFRYRFDLPAVGLPDDGGLPLIVQRYLRPGEYQLILKVEDSNGGGFFRQEIDLEVPRVEARRAAVSIASDGTVTEVADSASTTKASTAAGLSAGARVSRRLSEANASLSTGDHAIRILALPDVLQVGKLRVTARTRGEGIAKVAFELNDRPVMKKSRAPYSVELSLGDQPDFHSLRAIALDAEGEPLAVDEVLINGGPHRFDIRLIEPQSGKRYIESLRVRAEVEVPEGEILDRVEFYLNDTPVATLYQPPFEQPLLLPQNLEISYIRALAHLRGGDIAEDVQFINAPDFVDEMQVNFVELYTSVLDRKGQFIEGLDQSAFKVTEDGEPQTIRRFETMRDLPIRAGLVIDTSLSMMTNLPDVERAAYQFLESVMTERDRAAIVTFADEPRLAVRFTGDKTVLAGGLVGLNAEGETALYDSIIFTLHYFSGLKGKRAVVVLTDGADSISRYGFDDAIEFARRTGVAIYIIGVKLPSNERDVRMKIDKLAHETGGESYYVDNIRRLAHVYEKIQTELRSQYLIAYQSSSREEGFRKVEIEVPDQRGLLAKTLRGYYP